MPPHGIAKGQNWLPISKCLRATHFGFGLRFRYLASTVNLRNSILRRFCFYIWNNFYHNSIQVSLRSIDFIYFGLNYIILRLL